MRKLSWDHLLPSRSFGHFAAIGVVNTIVGMAAFPVLYWLFHGWLGVNVLLVLSWLVSTANAFFLHKHVTFKSTDILHGEAFKFMVLALVTLGINMTVVNFMMRVFGAHPVLVQFATTVVLSAALLVFNYVSMDRLIFKPSRDRNS